ncbi:acetyltransferase [Nostoc sp. TCL26-01]|uniref:acetyltransferase n=1 Tax=Nostoc sp. TCL26-01 TaxID=2576904 RepID=UPI0015BF245B|nr:acetyltransferase [Nostoc sp. TCL26-01]QLE59257.1 acetyltransferase [Nostoc sp. TCL26-01]
MFLQIKNSRDLVKILDIQELIDPNNDIVHGQDQEGQEEQETESFQKENLEFPSGESLPRCWLDANYRKVSMAH